MNSDNKKVMGYLDYLLKDYPQLRNRRHLIPAVYGYAGSYAKRHNLKIDKVVVRNYIANIFQR